MTALIATAKAEGALTTIALPRDWCNYGAAIDGFTKKYGITINELNPGGGSKDELAAITANKNNPGPAAPDVVDVGLAFGPQGVDQGLFQPYKVATWDTIPDSAKSADGMWYGDYFGVMSFEVNTKVVTHHPEGLGRPPEARLQEPGRPVRRPARLEPGPVRRLGGRPVAERRLPRQRRARPRLLQAAQRRRQLRAGHREHGHRRPAATPRSAIALDLQRPGRQGQAQGQSADRGRRPDVRPVRWHVRAGHQRLCAASRMPPSCGWNTCTPTKARTSG